MYHCLDPVSLLPHLFVSSFLTSFLASSAVHWGPTMGQALDIFCRSAFSLGRFDSLEMLSSFASSDPCLSCYSMAAVLGWGTGGQRGQNRVSESHWWGEGTVRSPYNRSSPPLHSRSFGTTVCLTARDRTWHARGSCWAAGWHFQEILKGSWQLAELSSPLFPVLVGPV